MNLENLDSYSQLEVGDLVFERLAYDDACQVSIFLGFYLKNTKIDNMLQKEFKNVRFTEDELENFELAAQNNVDLSYYCTPYYYTLARVLVVTKDEEKPLEQAILNPSGTFAYIKNMIEFMKEGNGADTQLHNTYSSSNSLIYRIKGVIDKEFIKNYILKLRLMGYLKGSVSILTMEDITNALKKCYLTRKKEFLLERNKFKKVLENPVVREIVQYGVYFSIVKKDGTKKYFVCIGHRKEDKAPVFLHLPLDDKTDLQMLDSLKMLGSLWIDRLITGRRIVVMTGKKLYDTMIRLPEPNYASITQSRYLTLKNLIIEDIQI